MNKFEFLAVLRSIKKVAKLGTKEDIEELVDDMISDAEGKVAKDKANKK